jgi:hypothetical protein
MWKSIAGLSAEDLASHPVWEWRVDGLEKLVRPTELAELPDPAGDTPVHIAATEFLAACGSNFLGYCSPADPSGLDYVQPVILAGSGPVQLWSEAEGRVDIQRVAAALGLTTAQLFPLHIRCLVPTAEGIYSEVVDGT